MGSRYTGGKMSRVHSKQLHSSTTQKCMIRRNSMIIRKIWEQSKELIRSSMQISLNHKYAPIMIAVSIIQLTQPSRGQTLPESRCYETKGKAVICLKEIAPNIFSAAANKPNGKLTNSGVQIPTTIIVNCRTTKIKGHGAISKKEIILIAQNICKNNKERKKTI